MRCDAKGLLALAMLSTVSASAGAEDRPAFPPYDIPAFCDALAATFSKAQSDFSKNCRAGQEEAMRRVSQRWGEAPPDIEATCLAKMRAGSGENYGMLATCLSLSVGARWMNGDLKLAH